MVNKLFLSKLKKLLNILLIVPIFNSADKFYRENRVINISIKRFGENL